MQDKQARIEHLEKVRKYFKEEMSRRRVEVAEQSEYTRMEIALRMMLDGVPDEKVARYTRLPMLIIESMYGLRDEIIQKESEAKSRAMARCMPMRCVRNTRSLLG